VIPIRTATARRDQRGVTLLEMLVVVAVLSIAVITIAVGLQTSQTATADASIRGQMHLALQSYRSALTTVIADGYWRPAPAAASCTSAADDAAAATTWFDDKLDTADGATHGWRDVWSAKGISFEITAVKYWENGPAFPVAGVVKPGGFTAGCGSPEQYAQMLVLSVSQNTTTESLTGSVVLRKPV